MIAGVGVGGGGLSYRLLSRCACLGGPGRQHHGPALVVADHAVDRALTLADRFSAAQAAQLVWALGRLHHRREDLVEALGNQPWSSLDAKGQDRLHYASPTHTPTKPPSTLTLRGCHGQGMNRALFLFRVQGAAPYEDGVHILADFSTKCPPPPQEPKFLGVLNPRTRRLFLLSMLWVLFGFFCTVGGGGDPTSSPLTQHPDRRVGWKRVYPTLIHRNCLPCHREVNLFKYCAVCTLGMQII